MDVERSFVSKVLTSAEIVEALDAKISTEYFEDEQCVEVWAWILDFWQRYSKVPGKKALAGNFPTFRVLAAEEPLLFYIDKLVEARAYAIMEEGVSATARLLKDRDVAGAKQALFDSMTLLARETTPVKDVDLTENVPERLERYRSYRDLDGGLRGLPSGFRFIDNATLGYQPQQLVTYIGLPKSGKSTMLMLSLMAVQDYAARSLLIGFEMSNEEQEARYDAFRAEVNWLKLMGGRLGPRDFKRLERTMDQNSNKPPVILGSDISATTTVTGVASKIEEHKPDICFVDGVYMMEAEVPGVIPGSPQALTSITRGLKRLAQRMRIPIVITTQVLPSKFRASLGLTMDSIGYTSSFAQDSDVIIGVEPVEGNEDQRKLRLVAGRNVRAGKTGLIQWDWEASSFEEYDMEGEFEGATEQPDPV